MVGKNNNRIALSDRLQSHDDDHLIWNFSKSKLEAVPTVQQQQPHEAVKKQTEAAFTSGTSMNCKKLFTLMDADAACSHFFLILCFYDDIKL